MLNLQYTIVKLQFQKMTKKHQRVMKFSIHSQITTETDLGSPQRFNQQELNDLV